MDISLPLSEQLMLHAWTTKDKRVIALRDLSDAHLDNILHMLENRYPGLDDAALLFGPPPNGEMAQMVWEQEIDRLAFAIDWETLCARVKYDALVREKERRTNGRETLAGRAQGWATARLATTYTRLHRRARNLVRRPPARAELAVRALAALAVTAGRYALEHLRDAQGSDRHQEGASE